MKGRWAAFGSLTGRSALDRLRSHPSNKRRDGGDPVTTSVTADDMALFGVGVNLKYRF